MVGNVVRVRTRFPLTTYVRRRRLADTFNVRVSSEQELSRGLERRRGRDFESRLPTLYGMVPVRDAAPAESDDSDGGLAAVTAAL